MRYFNRLLIILTIIGAFHEQSFVKGSEPNLTVGLVHEWLFEEIANITVINSIDPAFNGALAGAPAMPARTIGQLGNALSFDGLDDRVEIPALNLSGDAFTLSLWMNLASQNISDARLFSKASSTASNDHILMLSTINDRALRFRLKTAGNSTLTLIGSSESFAFNTWHHVAVTYDGSELSILIDGSEVASANITGDIAQSNDAVALANQTLGAGSKPLDGMLDQVRIYDQALTPEEIMILSAELAKTTLAADAGPYQIVNDSNGDGIESITLDASASTDNDCVIVSYDWQIDGNSIASGIGPSVSFSVGVHSLTLTITDDDGNTDSDTVVITVSGANVVLVSTEPQLQAAVSSVTAGTTIVLAPGNYQLSNTLYIHTDKVSIRGATGNYADVVILGSGMDNTNYGSVPHGIWTDASQLHIADLSIGEIWYHPVFLNGSADAPHLQNLRLFNAGEQFVKASSGGGVSLGCDDGIVEGCLIEYTDLPPAIDHGGGGVGYFNGIDVHGGQDWIIRNNQFINLHNPDGSDHPYAPTILMWNGAADTLVENNIFHNCDRSIAFGLIDRSPYDHQGGIIRNNFICMDPGLFSSARKSSADGAILVWDSADTQILHNTIMVNGNHPNVIQFRFETVGSEARNNLMDATIRDRENDASYVASDNTVNAASSLFVDLASCNLSLKSSVIVAQAPLLANCPEDIDGQTRSGLVDAGADEIVIGGDPRDLQYDDFVAQHFTPEEQLDRNVVGELADPDKDGLLNLMEYFLTTDPNAEDADAFTSLFQNDQYTFTYSRRANLVDIIWQWQSSTDLQNWQSVTPDSEQVLQDMGSMLNMRSAFDYNSQLKLFYRLKVMPNIPGFAGNLQFRTAAISVSENTNTFMLKVERATGSTGAVSVDWAISGGTATEGVDYSVSADTLNWADGDTDDQKIALSIIGDSAVEADETIVIELSNPQGGASLGTPAQFTVKITDNDTIGADLFAMSELTYTGAFRLKNGDFGSSSINYAIGTLAYNPDNHSLFIAGHSHHNAIAEYPIVPSGMQTTVGELPETGNPLQNFVSILDVAGNPEGINRITGMLWVDGALVVNAETWYDAAADNEDTTLVIRNANNIAGARDGYFELAGAANCGGYMGPIPTAWQSAFGAKYYTGWSAVYSITSRYSQGPSLWTFDPMDILSGSANSNPQVDATAFMNYPYSGTHLDNERGLEWEPQGTPGPFPPSSPLWNPLSQGRYGFFVPGTRTFAVIGSSGGLTSGIGYKAVQSDGSLCGGPCTYEPDDNYNYYWLFDIDEILAADAVSDSQPYDYGIWNVPFDDGGAHEIIGATLDSETGVLYVALANAGQVGTYDRPPLIITFELP